MEKSNEAEKHYRKALEIDPEFVPAESYPIIGLTYSRDIYSGAIDSIQKRKLESANE